MRILIVVGFALMSAVTYAGNNGNHGNNGHHNNHHGGQQGAKKGVRKQIAALQAQIDALQIALPPAHASVVVDCDNGELLADALATPAATLDITFSGTCVEDVQLERDDLTLTGAPWAVIEGFVNVRTARVTLTSVSIANAAGTGLVVAADAAVRATNLSVTGSSEIGITVFGGTLVCADCSSIGNAIDGMFVGAGGRVNLGGELEFNDNGAEGIEVAGGSSVVTLEDPTDIGAANAQTNLDMSGNAGIAGLLIYGAGSFSSSSTDSMNIEQNANGVIVATGGAAHLFGSISVHDNPGLGVSALGASVFLGGDLTADQNSFGVFVDDNGTFRGDGTATVTNSTNFGGFVRAGFLGDITLNLTGNGNELLLLQGANLILPNAQIVGNVTCDGSELISGPFVCGANP